MVSCMFVWPLSSTKGGHRCTMLAGTGSRQAVFWDVACVTWIPSLMSDHHMWPNGRTFFCNLLVCGVPSAPSTSQDPTVSNHPSPGQRHAALEAQAKFDEEKRQRKLLAKANAAKVRAVLTIPFAELLAPAPALAFFPSFKHACALTHALTPAHTYAHDRYRWRWSTRKV